MSVVVTKIDIKSFDIKTFYNVWFNNLQKIDYKSNYPAISS